MIPVQYIKAFVNVQILEATPELVILMISISPPNTEWRVMKKYQSKKPYNFTK